MQDVQIWKIITNGYPYKTIEELGVKNRKEAFTATKHALYCYIHKNNPDDYAPIEDIEGSPSNLAGTRTLMALKKILQDAENSTETKISSSLTINTSDWKYNPEINKDYVYKTYSVTSGAPIQKYKVTLARDNGQDIGGIKLVDENNNEADEFQSNQNFKIMIPIKNMTEDGGFNLTVEAKVKTKPVLYGASQKEGTQDYVLTTGMYEDGRGYISQKYQKNETKLIILKKDQDTGNMLEGVEFELLDEKYKPIYTDLKTDKNGKIVIENMIPGRYFLKETKSVDGYEVYPELVTVDLELQQEMTVTINNKKSEEPKVEKKVTNKEVSVEYITNDKIEGKKTNIQETKIKEVRKLPVAGM